MRTSLFIIILLVSGTSAFAQNKSTKPEPTPKAKSPDMSALGKDNVYNDPTAGDTDEVIPQIKYARWSVGAQFGIGYYTGDVPMDVSYPSYGLYVKYSMSHVLGLRLQYNQQRISGGYPEDKTKLSYFHNDLRSVAVQTIFNLGSVSFRKSFPRNNFYLGFGLGVLSMNASRDFPTTPGFTNYETYKNNLIYLPLTFGFKRKVSRNIDFGIEANYGLGGSDYIDMNFMGTLPDGHGNVIASVVYNITTKKAPRHMDWANPIDRIYRDIKKVKQETEDLIKKDGDGDGVPDGFDVEPDTPAGYKVDSKGKTLDSDNDGIPDSIDPDPYGFEKALSLYFPSGRVGSDSTGGVYQFSDSVPQTEFVTISESNLGLPTIYFPPNGFTIHVEQYGVLQQIARILYADTAAKVIIIGHSDNNKPDMTQLTLAEKRALEVKRKLYKVYEINEKRMLVFTHKDPYVQRYHLSTEGLNRKAEFRIIRPRRK